MDSRALDLARASGVGQSIRDCLARLAETLRRLGQLDAARHLLDEAFAMTLHAGSRNDILILVVAADLALDLEQADEAMALFVRIQESSSRLQHMDLQITACRGCAQALALKGEVERALRMAQLALQLARQHHRVHEQVEVLQLLSELHARYPLAPAIPGATTSAALHYLLAAMGLARGIEGYTVTAALYQAMGREYAKLGEFRRAYRMALKAEAARDKLHAQQVFSRANAMQIRFRTERERFEARTPACAGRSRSTAC